VAEPPKTAEQPPPKDEAAAPWARRTRQIPPEVAVQVDYPGGTWRRGRMVAGPLKTAKQPPAKDGAAVPWARRTRQIPPGVAVQIDCPGGT
jgi:hypothetical protein